MATGAVMGAVSFGIKQAALTPAIDEGGADALAMAARRGDGNPLHSNWPSDAGGGGVGLPIRGQSNQVFSSFDSFKYRMGPAGSNMQWHHIVEQTPGNVAKFGGPSVHNTTNIIAVDVNVHKQISAYYSSIQPFTGGLTVRHWLSTQSLLQQYQFGLNTLRQFGVIVP
jgi:hypothetical protein